MALYITKLKLLFTNYNYCGIKSFGISKFHILNYLYIVIDDNVYSTNDSEAYYPYFLVIHHNYYPGHCLLLINLAAYSFLHTSVHKNTIRKTSPPQSHLEQRVITLMAENALACFVCYLQCPLQVTLV